MDDRMYPPNSVGELNGLNYPGTSLDPDADILEVLALFQPKDAGNG